CEAFLSRRVRRSASLHQSGEIYDGNAVLFEQQNGQAIFEDYFFVRRNVNRLGAQCSRKSQDEKNQEQAAFFQRAHGLAFSWFSGSSVATVRLLAPKYVFATPWASSLVS